MMAKKMCEICGEKPATAEQELRRQLRIMQESLERKNRELDALHYVWCDGGCATGVHRWTEGNVTEELVAAAERNTARLRRWFDSNAGNQR